MARARFSWSLPMSFNLRPGLVYAACVDDIILLDLKQDRYFALPRALRSAFLAIIGGHNGDDLAHPSLSSLFHSSNPEMKPPLSHTEPEVMDCAREILARPTQSPSLLQLAGAFGFRAMAAVWLRHASLEHIVARLERRKRSLLPQPIHLDDAARIARAFECITPLFAIEDRCMAISIGLMMAMLRRQVPATMVIGVRTAPFSAHCWVEVDGHLVNEAPEMAQRFTPILVI
jgi:hypothetical protein